MKPALNYHWSWILLIHCQPFYSCMIFLIFLSTKSLLPHSLLFLAITLCYSCSSCFLWDLVPGEDLERNDGSSSRPYYMSLGLHKILRKGDQGAKLSAGSWAMYSSQTELLSLSLHHLCTYLCVGVWTSESEYCRARHWTGCIQTGQGWPGHLFKSSHRGHKGLEKKLGSLPHFLLSQLRYLPFFLPVFFSFFFPVYSLLTSALLKCQLQGGYADWGEVCTRQL